MSEVLVNYIDIAGLPICPTCGLAILPRDNIARPDGCIVHTSCLKVAVGQREPCEATP